MAQRYFPGEEAVGQHILMQETLPGTTQEIPWEIVGVIVDERLTPFDDRRESPAAYVTTEQTEVPYASLVVRTAGDPIYLQESVRKAVTAIDKDQALTNIKTVDQLKSESMAADWLRSSFLGVFAGIALLLSAIGIYGVIWYSVVQRTHEIGIRAALGATRGNLLRLLLRRGMGLTGMGLLLGVVGALGVTRLLGAYLFGVDASDFIALCASVSTLAGVAAIACYIPARRATRADPLVALRAE